MAVVAALQGSSPAFGRRSPLRRHRFRLSAVPALLAGLVVAARARTRDDRAGCGPGLHLQPDPHRGRSRRRRPTTGRCSCRPSRSTTTTTISGCRRSATCRCSINGTSIEADKVIYDQKTKRLHAEGNIRLTDADGKITYAEHHGSQRRLPRRLRRFAARRYRRADADGRDARRPLQRQLHRLRKRRLHRLRALQGRSEEAAAVAGQGRPHHPRSNRQDDVFRERAAGVLRRSDGVSAVFLDARSDREAQDRLPDAVHHVDYDVRVRR